LSRANEKHIHSISIPPISVGRYGFPSEKCASVILKATINWYRNPFKKYIEKVRVCMIDT
jgi:O-acetyl-ADP-ribose deacetylase (regulator of RNase III)